MAQIEARMPDDADLPDGTASVDQIVLANLACNRVKTFGDMVLVLLGRKS